MKSIFLFAIASCFSTAIFAQTMQPLNSLSELDLKATAVYFKNVASGHYIVLQPAPQGGGSLQGGTSPEAWYFYQAAGAASGNVEVKRKGLDRFNWSNYDNADDNKAFINWNHAKRLDATGATNTVSPAAPHAWTVEEVSPGIFIIKESNGQYMELMPNLKFDANSTGPKIITKALDNNNKHQQWIIEVDRKIKFLSCDGNEYKLDGDKKVWQKINGTWTQIGENCLDLTCNRRRIFSQPATSTLVRYNGSPNSWTACNTLLAGQNLNASTVMGQAHFLMSNNGKHFFYMQENGDLGIWSHLPEPKNIYSSQTSPKTNATLLMQEDGHLVAYDVNGVPFWSSSTHFTIDARYNEEKYKPVKLVLEDDGRIVLYSNTGFKVWDNVTGKYPLN